MASSYRSVRIVYDGRGRDILWWCLSTAFFTLITLGLYLPVAVNKLVRYIFENTEVHIQEPSASPAREVQVEEFSASQPTGS